MPIEYTEIQDEHPSAGAVEHMVRMRDGVRLATDLYLPDGWTSGPTVLTRLPYDKSSRYVFFTEIAPLFNSRGYAVVVQDVRGKFRSEGETLPYVHETSDGYDTLEWITHQGWSNGKVGMFGDSYYGSTQWAAVASQHPALRAIVPRVTGSNLGLRSVNAKNSDGRSRRIKTMWQPSYLARTWVDNHSYDFELDLSLRPIRAIFEDVFESLGKRSSYLDMLTPHPVTTKFYPGPHPYDVKPLPVLHVVGWFDNLKDQSMADYLALSRRPAWAPLQYLWVDSMDHENYRLTQVPLQVGDDHGADEEALERMLAAYVGTAADFFDVFLAETRQPDTLAKVRWHLGHGPDQLNDTDQWPPKGVAPLDLYLGDADRATSGGQGGRLQPDLPAESSATWVHDPQDLVPASIVDTFAILLEYPDDRDIHERDDVATFTTEPQDVDLDLVGPAGVTLRVASTAPYTDIVAKLYDIDVDGGARLVAWGDAQVDTVEEAPEFTIDLGHVGYRLRTGRSLRLVLSSSEYPWFQPNPGVAEPAWTAVETKASEQTLLCSSRTRLQLTVLPACATRRL